MKEDGIDAKEMTLGQKKKKERETKEEKETRNCTKDERKSEEYFAQR